MTLKNQDYADISSAIYDSNQYLDNHIARNLEISQDSKNKFR